MTDDPNIFDAPVKYADPREAMTSLLGMRCFKSWTEDALLAALEADGRAADVALWKRAQEVGWTSLPGGNIWFIDGSEKSQRLNAANEQWRFIHLQREFGFMAIRTWMMSRQDVELLTQDKDLTRTP